MSPRRAEPAHLTRLGARAPRSRAARRQLRKALGKQRGLEWRLFGNVTRRWVYARPDAKVLPLHPDGTPQMEPCSRSAGWTYRHPVPAVKDPARDDLNTTIAMNAKTQGHLLGRPK